MASGSKGKRSRRPNPIFQGHSNDCLEDETLSPSRTQDLPNLVSNQDNRRQNTKNVTENEFVYGNPLQSQDSSNTLSNQSNRRQNTQNIKNEMDYGTRSQTRGFRNTVSNRDNRGSNIRNTVENELADDMRVHHMQGSQPLPNNFSGKCVRGRGPYKGIKLDRLTSGGKNKLTVFMEPGRRCSAIGPHHSKLSSWLGYCSKRFGPPKVSWDEIENKHRSQLWSIVQDYFKVSMESPFKWKKLEEKGEVVADLPEQKRAKFEHFCFSQIQSSFRKWKNRLHTTYNLYSTDEERLEHVPADLDADSWKEMFEVFRNPDFQERSATNSGNRAHLTCVATSGPVPFAEVEYEMIDEEIGELPKASKVWTATHGISDEHGQKRFQDSKSREIYEDMRRIETEPTNEDEAVPSPDEVFLMVSGVISGHVRGKGLGYKASKRGMRGMMSHNQDEVKALHDEVARLKAELKANEERERLQAESSQLKDDQLQSVVQDVRYLLQLNNLRTRLQNGPDEDSISIDKS